MHAETNLIYKLAVCDVTKGPDAVPRLGPNRAWDQQVFGMENAVMCDLGVNWFWPAAPRWKHSLPLLAVFLFLCFSYEQKQSSN